MTEPIRIGIAGALGHMGRAVAAAVAARPGAVLAARFDREGMAGEGLVGRDQALSLCDVIVDFTTPQAAADLAKAAAERGSPALVIGPTGWSASEERVVRAAAKRVAIVKSGNFSLGVNMLMGLVNQAARALPAADYDIEVLEAHHRRKVDGPSGTALMLGEAAAAGRGRSLAEVRAGSREGVTGARRPGDIGFAIMRGGGVVGEHSVVFAAEDEILTLSHSARDRSLFARGAVEAAVWLAGTEPGLYDMQDVLGFERDGRGEEGAMRSGGII
jgi:4-hydroxy-tetrahydrodipicolinate reductase